MIAQTACSRDEPVPKLGPATRIAAPANRSSLRTNDRSSRHSEKRPLPKPVRSTRFSQSLGMIWSVSTSLRSSGTAVPVIARTAFIAGPPEWRSAGDGGGCRDGGGDEVGAAAAALASLEVAVRGRRAALLRRQLVGVHREAHRTPRLAPVEPRGAEDLVEAFLLGLQLHRDGAGDDHRPLHRSTCLPSTTAAAALRSSMRLFVHEPMNTVSTAIARIGVPALEAHVGEGPLGGLPVVRARERRRIGHRPVDRDHLRRVRSPRHVRHERCRVDDDLLVERRSVVGGERIASRRAPAPMPCPWVRAHARRGRRRSSRPER